MRLNARQKLRVLASRLFAALRRLPGITRKDDPYAGDLNTLPELLANVFATAQQSRYDRTLVDTTIIARSLSGDRRSAVVDIQIHSPGRAILASVDHTQKADVQAWLEAVARYHVKGVQRRFLGHGGALLWLEASGHGVADPKSREPMGNVVLLRDIPERRMRSEGRATGSGQSPEPAGRTSPHEQGGSAAVVGTTLSLFPPPSDQAIWPAESVGVERVETTDYLTGLPDRELFEQHFQVKFVQCAATGTSCAVLRVDLYRFKVVNEILGHRSADLILRAAAERIASVVQNEHFLARFDGDQFAIFVVGEQATCVEDLARRLLQCIEPPFVVGDRTVDLSFSIGIAWGPGFGLSAADIVRRAGLALDRAKSGGPGLWRTYEADQDKVNDEQLRLEFDLRLALQNRQFTLAYQPIVDATTERIAGFEALLRWRHAERGFISPETTVRLAEASGLIVPIGTWCLNEACRTAATWPDEVRVAVNVSMAQLMQPGFEQAVFDALANSGIAPHRLELELTETMLMRNRVTVVECLRNLRACSVRIALDDFGTGYSSLSCLHDLPIDKIKVDQSFIRRIHEPTAATLISSVIKLGHLCGYTMTAEGVETHDELNLALLIGFDEIQGFRYSPPVSSEQIPKLFETLKSKPKPDRRLI